MYTSFFMVGCTAYPIETVSPAEKFSSATTYDCFVACMNRIPEGDVTAAWSPGGGSNPNCQCIPQQEVTNYIADACHGNNDQYIYDLYRTAFEPDFSSVARRSVRGKGSRPALCPLFLTACHIEDNEGYECLDTRSELESCGGCRYAYAEHFAKNGTVGTE